MSPTPLQDLAARLRCRHDAIMSAWRQRVRSDPCLNTANALPRAQLQDHLPALLEDFDRRLVAHDPGQLPPGQQDEHRSDAAAHGLHRWQQGFDLSEVTRELGRFNECIIAEIDACSAADPAIEPAAAAGVRRIWAAMFSEVVSASSSQYFELQRIEAAGHVADLEQALESLRDLERQRGELWQEAAHDLRGNLSVVTIATAALSSNRTSGAVRERFLGALGRNVRALHRLLEDVTSLARLQSGREPRMLAPLDVSNLLVELAEATQAMAEERGLALVCDGPPTLTVESDAIKIRRIAQNLLFNAIKYTREGSVRLTWGTTDDAAAGRWFVQIQDTGLGFHAEPGAPIAGALEAATDHSKVVEADEAAGKITHVSRAGTPVTQRSAAERETAQQPGEGIGLSIVKRLCELLDATIEVDSSPGKGTTFRILLPRRYQAD
ncbi:MAG: ATP-binding protein [Lautropia sp.]